LVQVKVSEEANKISAIPADDTVKMLRVCVSRKTVEWLRSLDFGFFELDCLLIPGSTVGVGEELTLESVGRYLTIGLKARLRFK
jgi:hypothetical protein